MNVAASAYVRRLRQWYGPRARVVKIDRHGVAGFRVLDDAGRVLLQTFEAPPWERVGDTAADT